MTIDGHTHYLGVYATKASRAEYDRLIANGRQMPTANSAVTVMEMLAAFRRHAVKHYRKYGQGYPVAVEH